MKSKLALLALAGCALWGQAARADTVTSGVLVFHDTLPPAFSTSPSNGSFAYDDTTGQFQNITVSWDGSLFGATVAAAGTARGIYSALLAGTLDFAFDCTWLGNTAVPVCNDQFYGIFSDATGDVIELGPSPGDQIPPITPDAAEGTVSTPEPPAWIALGLGLVLLWAGLQGRRHPCCSQSA